jgi:hypothetical protein
LRAWVVGAGFPRSARRTHTWPRSHEKILLAATGHHIDELDDDLPTVLFSGELPELVELILVLLFASRNSVSDT